MGIARHVHGRAHALHRLVEGVVVEARTPARHHAGDEVSQPGQVGGVVHGAGGQVTLHDRDGRGGILPHVEAQPVVKAEDVDVIRAGVGVTDVAHASSSSSATSISAAGTYQPTVCRAGAKYSRATRCTSAAVTALSRTSQLSSHSSDATTSLKPSQNA